MTKRYAAAQMRFVYHSGLAALGTLLVAGACSSFQSTSKDTPSPDAGSGDGARGPIADASESEDAAPTEDSPDSDQDAGAAPCTETCRSHFCDDDGGCHPLAFISNDTYSGQFAQPGESPDAGLARADAICVQTAGGGTFRALLSAQQSLGDAITRFSGFGGAKRPVREYDGTMIATSYEEMFTSGMTNSVSVDLDQTVGGATIGQGYHVWTGTSNGLAVDSCLSWSSMNSADHGNFGMIGGPNNTWIQAGEDDCSKTNYLYCLEIVP